jgi:hypothetical protein
MFTCAIRYFAPLRGLWCGCALSLAFVWPVGGAEAQGTAVSVASNAVPKSVFVPSGKDPFFPNSTRPTAGSQKPDVSPTPAPVDASMLRLRGITGPADHRIALINNRTFAPGEQGEVSAREGKLLIRCVEIRERSVLVTVEGQPEVHELKLPDLSRPKAESAPGDGA